MFTATKPPGTINVEHCVQRAICYNIKPLPARCRSLRQYIDSRHYGKINKIKQQHNSNEKRGKKNKMKQKQAAKSDVAKGVANSKQANARAVREAAVTVIGMQANNVVCRC